MKSDFQQREWDEFVVDDCRRLIRLAVREDLDRAHDWTTISLVPGNANGAARVVARQDGVVAGLHAAALTIEEMDLRIEWEPQASDGDLVQRGQTLARISGRARDLLTGERTILNFIGRLSGIATLTRKYVDAIAGTNARLYDTRKTAPGWRRLEKYAVRRGGGHNHRSGLYDAVLIKDNHLAFCRAGTDGSSLTPAQAVLHVKAFLAALLDPEAKRRPEIIEIELDSLDAFEDVLAAGPDMVLLDNMSPERLCEAVARRDTFGAAIELEASGGVRLETVRTLAETGVERISCGSLTHSAVNFDVALDWE